MTAAETKWRRLAEVVFARHSAAEVAKQRVKDFGVALSNSSILTTANRRLLTVPQATGSACSCSSPAAGFPIPVTSAHRHQIQDRTNRSPVDTVCFRAIILQVCNEPYTRSIHHDDQHPDSFLQHVRPHLQHGRGGGRGRQTGRRRSAELLQVPELVPDAVLEKHGAKAGPGSLRPRPGGDGRHGWPRPTPSSSARRPASATWRPRCATSSTRPAACG